MSSQTIWQPNKNIMLFGGAICFGVSPIHASSQCRSPDMIGLDFCEKLASLHDSIKQATVCFCV
jgi:hypothetical protein